MKGDGSATESRPKIFLGIIDQVFEGMGQALSVRKLSFFLLSAFAGLIVCGLLIRLGVAISLDAAAATTVIAGLAAIGLSGVVAGGVAYLTVEEGRGRSCRLTDAFVFCGQRFVGLFFGAILLGLGVGLVGGLVNGMIAVFNLSRTIGSLVGSLLFLPQFLINACLVALCLVGVLVPCAVAVERIGPIRAIQRLVSLFMQRPGGLLLQFGITLYFGGMMLCVLAFVAIVSLGPTLATNGPGLAGLMPKLPSLGAEEPEMSGLFSGEERPSLGSPEMDGNPFSGPSPSRSRPEPETAASPGQWGDWLRYLGVGTVLITVLAFPVVFWICAFARYYESLLPSLCATAPAPLTPVAPPPLPAAGERAG